MHNASAIHAYTPYGHGTTSKSSLGFNGELRDPLTGLYSLGNGYRMYSPSLGKFCSPDSLSPFERGGINAYAYCEGDPVNWVDRDGHSISGVFKGIGITIKRMVTPGELGYEQFSPTRQKVHTEVDTSTLYGRTVHGINAKLGSHGDTNLPAWKGASYIKRSQSSGHLRNDQTLAPDALPPRRSISESGKFFATSPEWAHVAKQEYLAGSSEKVGAALVGVVANGIAAIAVAPHDHTPYKTGKILFYIGDEVTEKRK
ncbi:RHS repeat-associated core domain-containing protein [Pseudomonas monteilii]|uniref:RHS repeat-associated core domain-containing protein n=1 Tax=Pseudomonas monteilii TaxID=76759 RepID=UPI003816CE61